MEMLITLIAAQLAGFLTPEIAKLFKLVSDSKYRKVILQILSGIASAIAAMIAYLTTGSIDGLKEALKLIISGVIGSAFAYFTYMLSKRNHQVKE